MSQRSAQFVATILAGILAGTSHAALAENAAGETSGKPADTCLSSPRGPVPAGGHWYYRVDRATKRNCWYIREETGKSARAAPRNPAASTTAAPPAASPPASKVAADPASPQPSVNVRKSLADARAELIAPQARIEDLGGREIADAASSQRAAAPDAALPTSALAARWPQSTGISSSSGPRLAEAEPPQLQQIESPQAQTVAAPAPPPTLAPAPADYSQGRQSASTQMLLLTMAGALALAGITASLVFRFGGRARPIQLENRGERRATWDSVPAELKAPSMFPAEDLPIWHREPPRERPRSLPRDPRAPDDPERRVTEMLARLARSAQT